MKTMKPDLIPGSSATEPRARPSWRKPEPVPPAKRIFVLALPALVVYAVTTTLHLVLLAAMRGPEDAGLRKLLLAWDGGLYVDIAENGYPDSFTYKEDGRLDGNNLAFFPLFPTLIRVVHTVTRLDHGTSGIIAAHLSLIAALVVTHRLVDRLYGRRTATIALVLLAGAQPMALTFLMSYSEALFLALAVGTLLAAHHRAWLTAGALAFLTGLTRPAAAAVVAALAVAAGLHLLRERRLTWRPVAAVALGCVSTPLYLWWVGRRLGEPGAWFRIQEAGWGTHWDNGAAFLDFLGDTFRRGEGWVAVSTAVLLLGLLCATFLTWHRGTWPPLLVYGTGIVVLTLAQSNYSHSKLRLLVPAVLFLLPAARALARATDRTVAVSLTAATLFGCWYGAYMVTVWQYAI
ncbi:hypothetical protein [Streptomyces albireticuli]|uniref:hypothetical protein n=1 Tax=Streptomyces albireticuli TaxID=1940 RepID=UPI001E2FB495|nr:hypothetical protein [Streptomyces albireticuli]MCD9141033.1 hypothetical protein [Streptomyces albireticuli]MCD9161005.1 hypothetical protein [Streptomyces albireticuli]MCD9190937.1 hypothetical protein [Streptomyces albireticuli]